MITSLTASNKLIIEFDIPSKYAQVIKEGDSINCTIEGIGVISSSIYSLSPSIDPETQTLEARALYSNSKGVIPGSYARIRLDVTEKENALMIPTQAVIPKLNGQELYVVKKGKAVKLDVMTGIRTASMIEITEGIESGDSVIISGLLQVKPGAELKISAVNE